MILRRPYALLIKYFQKIHLALILLCAYIFYKITFLRTFVNDFIETESYNSYYESIGSHINVLVIISVLLVIVVTITLIVLLLYKKKPWKIYLIPLLEYVFILGLFIYITSYFNSYTELSSIPAIMAARDLLNIASIFQYVVFVIFGIRFLGIDLKKFGFKNDEEYLDIKEEDREEFEVNIEFDKDKITRNIKKFIRNAKYVYHEHKLVCNTIIIILFISLTGYTYYYFGVLHRTYKEGNTFNANYYDITVNSSYLTDRESNGTIINKNSNYSYLVLNITVVNKISNSRAINIDRFRVMNKNNQYRYDAKSYDYFKDLGNSYDRNKKVAGGDDVTFILVYRVDKDLDPSKYVLYYHDVTNNMLLKKTKLSVQDVRDVKTKETFNLNDKATFPNDRNLTITRASLTDSITYSTYKCDEFSCGTKDVELTPPTGKVLELSFTSNYFTGKSFVDFSNIYAKIRYKDTNGKNKTIVTTNLVSSDYFGNYAYFRIPDDIATDSNISLIFTFRNERYVYIVI